MAVVADVDADGGESGPEDRVAEIARLEEVLLPEAGRVRDVILPVLAEVGAVGVIHRRRVVVDPRLLALVHRHHHRHLVLAGVLRHQLGRRSGNRLGDVVPVRVLRRTEVRTVEHFLERQDLYPAPARLLDERDVDVDRRLANFLDRNGRVGQRSGSLDQAAHDTSGHLRAHPLCNWAARARGDARVKSALAWRSLPEPTASSKQAEPGRRHDRHGAPGRAACIGTGFEGVLSSIRRLG